MMQLNVSPFQPIDCVHHLSLDSDESLLRGDCTPLGGTDRVAQLVDDVARPGTLCRAQSLDLVHRREHLARGRHQRRAVAQRPAMVLRVRHLHPSCPEIGRQRHQPRDMGDVGAMDHRVDRQRHATRDDVPGDVLQCYLELVLDGLVARSASGEDPQRLSAVLDLVENSVRRNDSEKRP